jgi:hypothetical protein
MEVARIDDVSLDTQGAKIELRCGANDLEFVAFYSDAGLSGSRGDSASVVSLPDAQISTFEIARPRVAPK